VDADGTASASLTEEVNVISGGTPLTERTAGRRLDYLTGGTQDQPGSMTTAIVRHGRYLTTGLIAVVKQR
jgi:hypothetical protein